MNWYFEAWKKYAVFGERAGRQEFWFFVLFHILAYILLSIVAGVIGGKIGATLVFLLQGSQPDENRYGAIPNAATA